MVKDPPKRVNARVKEIWDGTVRSSPGLGFISLGAPDLAVSNSERFSRPLPRPAPAFVCACHLPGNRTKLISGAAQSQHTDLHRFSTHIS